MSIAHAIMPDHWLPMVLISRAEKWSHLETIWITTLITIPHLISTIALGILVGLTGFQLTAMYESLMEIIAPLMLVLIGLFYVYRNFKAEPHHHKEVDYSEITGRSKKVIVMGMATALFFSPCVPIGSYFIIIGVEGISSLITVSAIYVLVTLIILILMVSLGRKGVDTIRWHYLEHNENLITGIILIIIGLFVFFLE